MKQKKFQLLFKQNINDNINYIFIFYDEVMIKLFKEIDYFYILKKQFHKYLIII
jgi:hypothetical protein